MRARGSMTGVEAGRTRRPPVRGVALARSVAAAGAGVLLYASFPPRALWWLAPIAFALWAATLRGRRSRVGLAHGLLFGLGLYVPLLPWVGSYVGAAPWLALATVEALFVGVAGAALARLSRTRAAPLWAACVWVAAEAAMARVPFGGFPWGKVAYSQTDGPFLVLASLGGAPLVSFAVALTGFAAAELVRRLAAGSSGRPAVPALLALAPVVAIGIAPLLRPVPVAQRTATVAAIQGNVPRLGLDFNAQRRAVLDNHVRRTEELAQDVAAGRAPRPDLVVWPENASDIDPFAKPDAAARIDAAATAIGAPIHVGTVLSTGRGRETTNTSLVWEAGAGAVARVDKRRVVPFGEYLPWRGFFRMLSPYADRAGFFVAGPGPGVLPVGGVRMGVAICWEIAFDDLIRDSVRNGAEFLAVPSNNATFGLTDMTYQQQAMSRLRAAEHDRAVVVAATSGSSAVIAPDGSVLTRSAVFTPATLVERIPLRTTTTLATRLGGVPEWMLAALGLAALTGVEVGHRRSARAVPATVLGRRTLDHRPVRRS